MSKIDEIKKHIADNREQVFQKAIKEEKYSTVLRFFHDEIQNFFNDKVTLQNQLFIINQSIKQAGFKNFEIQYRTYQQYCARKKFTAEDKNFETLQLTTQVEKSVNNRAEKKDDAPASSTENSIGNMLDIVGSLNSKTK